MKTWQKYCVGLAALAGFVTQGPAQSFPGVPTVAPPPPPVAAVPVAAAPPAASPSTLWSFLGLSKAQKQACREKLCQTQLGLLLNNTMAPLRVFTGGIVPPLCPGQPTAAELADKGPVGAAAAIKKDEAEAKARIAAVKYLGTVSCHYWPEAQGALIDSLRKDRNECVRWQAALALGSGCCCTKATIKALAIAASGSGEDGQPEELSPRVRAAAEAALYHCLDCFTETVPAPPKEIKKNGGPEQPPPPAGPEGKPVASQSVTPAGAAGIPGNEADVRSATFFQRVESQPAADVLAEARRVLTHGPKPIAPSALPPAGSRGLVSIVAYAAETAPQPIPANAAPQAPKAAPVAVPLLTSQPKEPEPPTNLYDLLMNRRKTSPEHKKEIATILGEPKPLTTESAPLKPGTPIRTTEPAPKTITNTQPARITLEPLSRPLATPAASTSMRQTSTTTPSRFESPRASLDTAPRTLTAPSPLTATTPAAPNGTSPWGRTAPAPTTAKPASAGSYATLASAAPAATTPSAQDLLHTLRESPNPFQKEMAADKLATVGWPPNGTVIAALVKAARTDPAATVRVHCIRTLVQRNVRTPEVLKAIKDLKADTDPRVRHEAEMALTRLGDAKPAPTNATGRPVSIPFPARAN